MKRYLQRHWGKQAIRKDLFEVICRLYPNHQNLIFVDLFGWWWSMSSFATSIFKKVIYNEIDKWIVDLFVAIQNDDFIKNLKEKWITREEFYKIRDEWYKTLEENMVLTIWSFWNSRRSYIYWKENERRKYLTHKIIFSKTEEEYKHYIKLYNNEKVAHFEKYWAIWDCFLYDDDWKYFIKSKNKRYYKFWKRSRYYRKFYKWFDMDLVIKKRWVFIDKEDIKLINDLKQIYNNLQSLESLERLQSLESLERLQRLENLESLQSLQRLERLERLESLQSLERLETLQSLQSLERLERLESLQSLESLQRLESLERLQRLEHLESLETLQRLERLEGLQSLESLQRLQNLERLERLEGLQRLESLENLEVYNLDYRQVKLPKPNDCIIYLDPPYKGTSWYKTDFIYDEFEKYVLDLKEKWYTIFLSEYNFPFGKVIWNKNKRWFISQTKDKQTWKEKLFII